MTGPDEQQDRSSLMPILTAVGVVVLVLIAFWISTFFRGDALTPELRVARAAVGQNDALQRGDYAAFRSFTCAAEHGGESEVLARQHQSTTAKGARFVDDVTAVAITGDRATATVTYHFERSPEDEVTTPMVFTRDGEDWKVCSPGPG